MSPGGRVERIAYLHARVRESGSGRERLTFGFAPLRCSSTSVLVVVSYVKMIPSCASPRVLWATERRAVGGAPATGLTLIEAHVFTLAFTPMYDAGSVVAMRASPSEGNTG